jgi:hypothetical protein
MATAKNDPNDAFPVVWAIGMFFSFLVSKY